MSYHLYWGDLHSHCSISYGYGTVEQAIARARQQLDFCSVTGHAFWPDMPADRERYGQIIDYHNEGFARLARNWPQLLEKQAAGSVDGRFLTLPSYEWHSLRYGDHNVYAAGPELSLEGAADLPQLQQLARERDLIAVPHHIGYAAGYRGIDWQSFRADASPLVEIFSLHGCSESSDGPYPMLHDMGPRDAGSTASAGWLAGHRFGIIGSTDHHGGYPGSHGDGRLGVYAEQLTRAALWEALKARRVFAATGDKIDPRLQLDGAWPGEVVQSSGRRRLRIAVRGIDRLDRVELLKNERVLHRFGPEAESVQPHELYRLRLTWGWGRKDVPVRWQAEVHLSDGELRDVEPCFSGQAVVAPKGVGGHEREADQEDLPHEVLERHPRGCRWRSVTTGNLSMRHATTQSLSLLLDAPPTTRLHLTVNGQSFEYQLGELLGGGRSRYLRGWLSEAILVGPLVPHVLCGLAADIEDQPQEEVDCYRLRVAQRNGQWAWSSPIWAER